jgi:hypothetical protein
MPLVGFGVYQNPSCKPACLVALQSGYRSVSRLSLCSLGETYGANPQAHRLRACVQE